MERLTERDDKGNLLFNGKQVYAGDFYEAVSCLEEYEDTDLTPEQIRELKEPILKLRERFGDALTVNQVVDFFVDFYIAQGDTDRVEEAVLLTNEATSKYKELKERDTAKEMIITGFNHAIGCKVGECPKCGAMTRDYMRFCDDCGQRLK